MAISPDGRMLASLASNQVKIWDLPQHSFRALRLELSGQIAQIRFSPNNDALLTWNFPNDATFAVWDIHSGKKLFAATGHTGAINSVVFRPDGKVLASASEDHTIRTWDATSGALLRTIQAHLLGVQSLAYSTDGLRLFSTGDEVRFGDLDDRNSSSLKIWDPATGQELKQFVETNDLEPFRHDLLPTSNQHIVSLHFREVWIQEQDTGRVIRKIKTGASSLTAIAVSPNAKWIATGDDSGLVRVWDASSGYEIYSLRGHTAEIKSLTFAPDRTWLASGSSDGTIRLWDPLTGASLATLVSFSSGRDWVSVTHDSNFAGSPGGEAQVVLHQGTAPEVRLSALRNPSALSVLLASLGPWESTAHLAKTVLPKIALSVPPGTDLANATGSTLTLRVHISAVKAEGNGIETAEIQEVQLLHNGQLTRVWATDLRLTNKGEADLYERVPVEVGTTKYSAVAITSSGQRQISELTISSDQVAPELAIEKGHVGFINKVLFGSKGPLIASGGQDGAVNLWDSNSGRQIRSLLGHTGAVMALAFSPDGNWLASGGYDSTVALWQVATGRHIRSLANRDSAVLSLAFSPKGPVLAAGRKDFAVDLWDLSSGRPIRTLVGHRGPISCVAFSPDGRLVASASLDQTVRIWDASVGRLIRILEPHKQGVVAISFSPDSRTLVSGEQFGTIRFWDLSTGKQFRTLERAESFDSSVPEEKMPFLLDGLAFSPDGRRFATSDGFLLDKGLALWITAEDVRGSIKIFDSKSGQQLSEFKDQRGVALNGVSFSPDGKRIAWGDNNGRIRLINTLDKSEPTTYLADSYSVTSIAVSTNWLQLATIGDRIHLWDLQGGTSPEVFTDNGVADAFAYRRTNSDAIPTKKTIRALCDFISRAKGAGPQASWYVSPTDVSFSSDGRWLALVRNKTSDVAIWDTTTLKLTQKLGGIEQGDQLRTAKFSSNGKLLVSVGSYFSNLLVLWDGQTGRQLRTVETGLNRISSAIFSPNNWSVAVASEDGISIWDIGKGRREDLNFENFGPVDSLAFSPRGDLLASSGQDGQIRIWDMETAKPLRTLTSDARSSASLLFIQPPSTQHDPDALTLISSTYGGTTLWDARTGQQLATLLNPGNESDWLVATPDGLFDGTASAMRRVAWRIADSNQTSSFDMFFEDFFRPGLLDQLLSGERPKAQVDISTALQVPGLHQMLREGLAHVENRDGKVIVCFQQKPGVAVNANPDDQRRFFPPERGYRVGTEPGCPVEKPLLGSPKDPTARIKQLQEWKAEKVSTPWDGLQSETAGSTLHVLTIGVGQYEVGTTFPALPYATQSAKEIEAFFQKQQTNPHSPYKAVRLWGGLYDTDATRENIRKRLSDMAKEVDKNDVVFLYLVGHGVVPVGEEMFYFVPIDGRESNLRDSAVSTAMIADILRNLPARRIVLVVDACQSGGAIDILDRISAIKVQAALRDPQPDHGVGVHIVAATLPLSYAVGLPSTAGNQPPRSVLAQTILRAFEEGTGRLTASQLAAYIKNELPVVSERAINGFHQVPLVDSVGLDFPIAVR